MNVYVCAANRPRNEGRCNHPARYDHVLPKSRGAEKEIDRESGKVERGLRGIHMANFDNIHYVKKNYLNTYYTDIVE